MRLSEAEALQILPLEVAKSELRIPTYSPPPTPTDPTEAAEAAEREAARAASEAAHDSLLSGQIHSAVNFVMQSTGADAAELPTMRAAIVAALRSQYDGAREITETSAIHAWANPFRSVAD